MKVDLYNAIVSAQMSRRKMLKGSASLGAVAAMGGLGGAATAGAHGGVRAEIMKIPGVGMGSPGDPEWQKVGELCKIKNKTTNRPLRNQNRLGAAAVRNLAIPPPQSFKEISSRM